MVTSQNTAQLRHLEAALKALANRRRLLMLAAVRRHGDIHVSALAEHLRLPVKTVSRNLRLLERAGLMHSDPRQGFVFYRLSPHAPAFAKIMLEALATGN